MTDGPGGPREEEGRRRGHPGADDIRGQMCRRVVGEVDPMVRV